MIIHRNKLTKSITNVLVLVAAFVVATTGTVSASSFNPQGGVDISNGNFTGTGSKIFDDGELHVATDSDLFLDAPVRVSVSNNLGVKGSLELFNGNFTGTGSKIFDDGELRINTDNALSINAPSMVTVNSSTLQATGAVTAASFSGAGSALTALSATNVASGTLADARLGSGVTLQGNTFNGANQLVQLNSLGQLPALSGVNLTALNATNLTTGTVADARLSANVALLNGTNTFSGVTSFTGVSNLNGGAKIGTNGTTITQLQSGTGTCGTAVTFPAAFSSAPRVVATITTDPGAAGAASGATIAAFSATTTGFSNACRDNAGVANTTSTFSWIANN